MSLPHPLYSKEEHAKLGNELYEQQIRPQLESTNQGEIVAIDVDSGSFEVAENMLQASEKLREHIPNAQIWCIRVGQQSVHRFGSRVSSPVQA